MKLLRHERTIIVFLLRHMLFGMAGALLFGALVLYFDIGHLRSLAFESQDGLLTLGLFFFGLLATFGSIAMGVGVMGLGRDEN
ncbi:hypothetical protein [Telmatospirillum siberiense]|uniref:Uncharacterized protein n=1 Tax=Telmatospirillum siberiense TaxID=382514 RepID=A0A2N3PMN7_9PROT|nr:hypothetical protein [Telmatospirillum siberiense]PKU21653.1 hypothetical protein CWS72_25645 [Telmatospirillum siberiense]